jgi:hypothetical protein
MMADDLTSKQNQPVPQVPPELAVVVRAGVKAAKLVPGAIALGGTVCSLYAGHRLSKDIDFVITNLKERYDDISETLNSTPGWKTRKQNPVVTILGKLDGIDIGYRQLRRTVPLETVDLVTPEGTLAIPTLVELIRIKAFLACERNFTRDYFDFAELTCLIPRDQVLDALEVLDEKMGWENRPHVTLEVMKSLADCEPIDCSTHGFETFNVLMPRVKSWDQVRAICKEIAGELSKRFIKGEL